MFLILRKYGLSSVTPKLCVQPTLEPSLKAIMTHFIQLYSISLSPSLPKRSNRYLRIIFVPCTWSSLHNLPYKPNIKICHHKQSICEGYRIITMSTQSLWPNSAKMQSSSPQLLARMYWWQVLLTPERLRHCLFWIMQYTSFGNGKIYIRHLIKCGTDMQYTHKYRKNCFKAF